jgi:hypothetical protein
MTTLTDMHLWNRFGRRWLVTMLLVNLIFAIEATVYFNAMLNSAPVSVCTSIIPNQVASQPSGSQIAMAGGEKTHTSVIVPLEDSTGLFTKAHSTDGREGTAFANIGVEPGHNKGSYAPFLDIVPLHDGTGLFIKAHSSDELEGTVFANIGIGPGHNKGSYTMPYSETHQAYVTTAPGFFPGELASGPINITTTLGLDSGAAEFSRPYIPSPPITKTISIFVQDLELSLVSTDTLDTEAYIVAVRSYAPPGPLPWGHRLVGSAYSVRASGALTATNRPMSLHLAYNEITLAGADPHTLAIFAWDAYNKRWDNLGGTRFSTQQFVSATTRRFTTYALMATQTWRDEFDDLSGMDFTQFHNVTWGGTPENRTLVLVSTATSGTAVSNPITPTTGFAAWGSLAFSRTIDPPTTTLTVDVLGPDGSTVLTDVASGTNLADLVDPAQHPSLRLRVNMSSTVRGETPALDRWQLAWQGEERHIYLPVVWR